MRIPPPPPLTAQQIAEKQKAFRIRTPRKWNDYRFNVGNISEQKRSERINYRELMKPGFGR